MPIGLVAKLAGKGIAMGAEYREHRKEQKQARAAATEELEHGTTTGPEDRQMESTEALPAYTDRQNSSHRTLEAGPPASADQKWDDISSQEDSDSDDTESIEDDEELQALDEALEPTDSNGLPTYDESEAQYTPVEELVREVMNTNPPAEPRESTLTRPQIPLPVILPQRRPRKKARGFIRAYSPVLADCGIDQEVFLKFLKNFHKSSQASPIFPIIQISAAIAGLVPSVIAMAVTTAVQIAAGVGAEVQSRTRTNTFLDSMNEELFKPAGLYAMIVKYKSDSDMQQSTTGIAGLANLIKAEKVDVTTNQTIAKYNRTHSDESGSRSMNSRMKDMRLASNTTKGTAMLPESAPLIFPELDRQAAQAGPETFKDKTKDAKKFLANYFDRRAQFDYASQDPSSSLAVPQQHRAFKSARADPNHPMYSGGLVALLSGGKMTPIASKRERRMERDLFRDQRRLAVGCEPRSRKRYGDAYREELFSRTGFRSEQISSAGRLSPAASSSQGSAVEASSSQSTFQREARSRNARRRNRKGGPLGAVKRAMREDVLYLMIVNMPSEAELAEAREELERAQQH
ncbi:hypothetical protein CB0940_01990 [Cercospora beticola]|uniref:Uncharacterized protein n=1 Tax=Cercospora beticola TaxID=122368 RepID=A0A2G5IAR9_CERBT|nr:hypothetical protein CB0940_01990 [Cercospora beticola]PIB01898.1 hypothetical protein CB0940_01990 [Cercospora beticola]WPA97456.1 hypothetical protein RHO25_002066 [Cercospora beticola]